MTSTVECGICHYDDTIKDARQWCTNCEEGLCEDCEKVHRSTKNTRTHKIISIDDYREIKDVLVSHVCEQHGKSYDLYCPTHDNTICIVCIDQHKSCSQVIPLTEAVVNIKESTALSDLENKINGALHNSKKNIIDIKSSAEAFDKQEENIKKCIKEVREELNKHLDEMEQKLTEDFATKYEYCNTAYANTIKQLISSDDKLANLKNETESIKRFASDEQIFLGTRAIGKVVEKEITSIKTIYNAVQSYEINFELDANISSFLDNVSHLGSILVKEENVNLQFKEQKLNQAQMQVSLPLVNVVHELQLKHMFKLEKASLKMVVTGCIMLANGDMLIADHWNRNIVLISNESDKPAKYINISDFPYDITMIDHNLIVITHGTSSNTLDVLNL
ncbi:protein wech-like isoform X1 [Mytilus californianus]|uniref:protein wech-like isoform X1 n=1 Tax=Mytilus californianus TaxID=6549 RepID=UPI00224529ED|nr:protein wech-like isoform X1 [Mytilus californianus]XP_052066519.1 protein wech-like isoform X1 [Mytilus californianus]